jgi:hypothetical protein
MLADTLQGFRKKQSQRKVGILTIVNAVILRDGAPMWQTVNVSEDSH